MLVVHGAIELKLNIEKGAPPPERWQLVQFLYKIGATSLKVLVCALQILATVSSVKKDFVVIAYSQLLIHLIRSN
jgi:hypothetical protein